MKYTEILDWPEKFSKVKRSSLLSAASVTKEKRFTMVKADRDQSDQIGRFFQQLGYFCRLSKEMVPKWQYHLLHFHLNKLFKHGLYFRII